MTPVDRHYVWSVVREALAEHRERYGYLVGSEIFIRQNDAVNECVSALIGVLENLGLVVNGGEESLPRPRDGDPPGKSSRLHSGWANKRLGALELEVAEILACLEATRLDMAKVTARQGMPSVGWEGPLASGELADLLGLGDIVDQIEGAEERLRHLENTVDFLPDRMGATELVSRVCMNRVRIVEEKIKAWGEPLGTPVAEAELRLGGLDSRLEAVEERVSYLPAKLGRLGNRLLVLEKGLPQASNQPTPQDVDQAAKGPNPTHIIPPAKGKRCPRCHRSDQSVACRLCNPMGGPDFCPDCKGFGRTSNLTPCLRCSGSGLVEGREAWEKR